MNWTDERIETLKKLWAEGLSASQIANQLGDISRNAVVGKVHRLKLAGRGRTSSAPKSSKPKRPYVPPAPKKPVEVKVEPAVIDPTPPIAMEIERHRVYRSQGDPLAPTSRRLALTELTERTCKWPSGDPLTEEFSFCGNDSSDTGSYCSFHARLAYQSASERAQLR